MNRLMLATAAILSYVANIAMLLPCETVVPNVALGIARDVAKAIVDRTVNPSLRPIHLAAVSTIVKISVVDLLVARIPATGVWVISREPIWRYVDRVSISLMMRRHMTAVMMPWVNTHWPDDYWSLSRSVLRCDDANNDDC